MPTVKSVLEVQAEARAAAQTLRILLVAVLIVPVLLFILAATLSYRDHFAVARDRLEVTLDLVHEHATKVLETQQLLVAQVEQLIEGMPDQAVLGLEEQLHRRLKDMADALEQINSIWILDGKGLPLVTSNLFPAPRSVSLADRDYFRAHQQASPTNDPTFVGEMLEGRSTPGNFFMPVTSRRRGDGSQNFAGIINISLDRKYFESFYAEVARSGLENIALTRADGALLARYPSASSGVTRLPPGSPFHRAITQDPQRGTYSALSPFDGAQRTIAYRKLGTYPVYVTAAYDEARVKRQWLSSMASHLVFGLPATAALFLLTALAIRRTEREVIALANLREESTRREASETQLRQMQKMEAIGHLTGGIAHDFNNFLTVVIGSLELLIKRSKDPEPRNRQLAENALAGATRAADLTKRLLAFSRQQPLDPKAINLNRLIQDLSELLRHTLGEQNIIETVLAGGLWPAFVDASQLENAILNLAVNARDAMPKGGKLTIETANSHIDEAYAVRHPEAVPGQYVMVSVTDTGTGMSQEVIAKAFEPFFSTKGPSHGTGLGLSQVYGFVKQTGGHARIYSEPGVGTTVRIYLPRFFGPADAIEEGDKAPPKSAREGECVLVVEDDPDVLAFTRQALIEAGYDVLTASSGKAALEILRENKKVGLLLTDVVMPEMNGRMLADQATALRPDLKVLYMTGYTRNAIVHNNMLDPGTQLISKPFTVAQLASKLREVLG